MAQFNVANQRKLKWNKTERLYCGQHKKNHCMCILSIIADYPVRNQIVNLYLLRHAFQSKFRSPLFNCVIPPRTSSPLLFSRLAHWIIRESCQMVCFTVKWEVARWIVWRDWSKAIGGYDATNKAVSSGSSFKSGLWMAWKSTTRLHYHIIFIHFISIMR